MSASIFDLKSIIPNDAMLAQELGLANDWLCQIRQYIESNYSVLTLEWKYYGLKSGWILKLLLTKRNILFVIPLQKSFKVVLTFGEKALSSIDESDIPSYIKQDLHDAMKHAEGRTIQVHITSGQQLTPIFELIKIKLNS